MRGPGIGTVTFIVFLVLKLCGAITWSWWWITSPLWIVWGFICICLLVIGFLESILRIID
jgi:hypothetical protein